MLNLSLMKRVVFFLCLSTIYLHAGDNPPLGARSQGMAGCGTALTTDVWGVQNNQASLAGIESFQAGVFYESRFLVSELGMKGVAAALPTKYGSFGLNVNSFGYSLYSETKAGLAYARKLSERFSMGVQLDYYNTRIGENYGSSSAVVGEIGILAEPVKNLFVGLHLFNPTRTRLSGNLDERLPTIMRFGMSYKFSDQVFVIAEAEKDVDFKTTFRGGLEYRPIPAFYIRAGAASNPGLVSMGFGVVLKKFRLDIASSFHSVLGFSPSMGLQYGF
jgi:hypothetical protein